MSRRSSVMRAAALGAGMLLAPLSCKSMRVGANPDLPLWTHRPSGSMTLSYRQNLVASSRRLGEPYERGQPAIDPKGRRVFVGSSDRGLYALRAEDGSLLWRFETLGFVQCEPLYDEQEDVVYFGSNDGALYKVEASTGRLRWRFMTNAEVARRPVLADGKLFVVNANDTVVALDAGSGKLSWSQHRTPALGMEIAGYAGPLLWRDKVYAAFSDGTVSAFDASSGAERWQPVDLAGEAEQYLGELPKYFDVDTTPVANEIEAGPVIYVGSYAGGVYALDAETGSEIWSNPAVGGVSDLYLWQQPRHPQRSGKGLPLPARSLLLASTGTTGLWALDPEDGREIWRKSLPTSGVSRPIPWLGALLVSTSQLGLFLLHPLDGRLIDGIHTGDGINMVPAAYGHRAFVLTNQGSFLSLTLASPVDDTI